MSHTFDPPFHAVFFFEPPVVYDATVPGRWPTLLHGPHVDNEPPEQWVQRMRLTAQHWAKEDYDRPENVQARAFVERQQVRKAAREAARAALGISPPPKARGTGQRGRPELDPLRPGESQADRVKRQNREAQQRYRERHGHRLPAGAVVMSREQLSGLLVWFLAQRDGVGNDPTDAELDAGLAVVNAVTA